MHKIPTRADVRTAPRFVRSRRIHALTLAFVASVAAIGVPALAAGVPATHKTAITPVARTPEPTTTKPPTTTTKPPTTTTKPPTTTTKPPTTTTKPPTPTGAGTPVAITNDQPVGAPAGDYRLTAQLSAPGGSARGTIVQFEGGKGAWERVADFHATQTAAVVTAEVRVAGPADVFWVVGLAPLSISNLTLTPAMWGFVVRGTKITSPTSAAVVWHGVNSNPDWPLPTIVDQLASTTRADIVRVPVDEENWLPFFTAAYNPTYRQGVINLVNDITAHGMTAIVDLHNAGHDAPSYNPGYSGNGQLAPDQQSLAFWQDAATLWSGNPGVVFETFNEPQIDSSTLYNGLTGAQVWRDGGTVTADGYTWRAPGMQQVVNTIRATGASNVILVDGPDWASNLLPLAVDPIDGTNLAYAFHVYADQGADPSALPGYLLPDIAPMISASGVFRYASVVTELGTTAPDSPASNAGSQFLTTTAQWIESQGSGWLVWGWYPDSYDAYGLLSTWPMGLDAKGKTVVSLF